MAIVTPPRVPGAVDPGTAPGPDAAVADRRARPLRARFSAGHLLMVVAGLVGVVLSLAVLRDRPTGVRVAVADGEIRAGDVVDVDDFRAERLQASDALLDTLVAASDVRSLRGRIAVSPIADGELVARSQLHRRAAPGGLRAMSIPIDASRAAGGRIEPGDRIDVVFAGEREASIIVPDAKVIAVDESGRGGIGEVSRPFTVTVAVNARQSQLLAAAIADGDLSITRTTGASSARGTEPLDLDRVTEETAS
jgi:Flp pilus assembly protein CpaB